MKHLDVEVTDELAEWINETCDEEGYDYGPLIGVLFAVGLSHYAIDNPNPALADMAVRQYLLSCKLAGYRSELVQRWSIHEHP